MLSPIAIVGATGDLGFGLALRLAKAGLPVAIGSRAADRAAEAAARARQLVPGAEISGHANPDAVALADLVVLSVPFASQAPTLRGLREAFREGTVLLDVTVPLATAVGGRPTRVLSVWQGSAAQQAQELVPDGVTVVSALHTVAAKHLADLDHVLDEDAFVTGDSRAAKLRVAELIRLIPGLRPVDAGRLEMARITETFTALTIGLNIRNRATTGLRVTGLADNGWGEPQAAAAADSAA